MNQINCRKFGALGSRAPRERCFTVAPAWASPAPTQPDDELYVTAMTLRGIMSAETRNQELDYLTENQGSLPCLGAAWLRRKTGTSLPTPKSA
jgi:hypothetical protein